MSHNLLPGEAWELDQIISYLEREIAALEAEHAPEGVLRGFAHALQQFREHRKSLPDPVPTDITTSRPPPTLPSSGVPTAVGKSPAGNDPANQESHG